MDNKYNIQFTMEVLSTTIMRLINQIWKLIPMKENKENCEKQLETVILEIAGMSEIFFNNNQFLQILCKLEGLKAKQDELDFNFYRKTVFEVISLLQELKNEG